MQYPQNHGPAYPGSQQPYAAQPQNGPAPRPKRRGRFRRFVRGYLMLVGALTTLYVLVMLLVSLFVEVGKWAPTLPIS